MIRVKKYLIILSLILGTLLITGTYIPHSKLKAFLVKPFSFYPIAHLSLWEIYTGAGGYFDEYEFKCGEGDWSSTEALYSNSTLNYKKYILSRSLKHYLTRKTPNKNIINLILKDLIEKCQEKSLKIKIKVKQIENGQLIESESLEFKI